MTNIREDCSLPSPTMSGCMVKLTRLIVATMTSIKKMRSTINITANTRLAYATFINIRLYSGTATLELA